MVCMMVRAGKSIRGRLLLADQIDIDKHHMPHLLQFESKTNKTDTELGVH